MQILERSDQNFEMLFESQKKIKWISSIDTPIENFINSMYCKSVRNS